MAIGAQNALVLRQGIKREHVFAVAAACTLIDWVLIIFGAGGFGTLIALFPAITAVAAWGGAAFLFVYGALSFRSATKSETMTAGQHRGREPVGGSVRAAIAATLAVSLLNPHVYLDTVVLLGSIAAQYESASRVLFVAGACTASAAWFFGLAFGARLLAPLFARPIAWRVLDVLIGVVMWTIATTLVLGQL